MKQILNMLAYLIEPDQRLQQSILNSNVLPCTDQHNKSEIEVYTSLMGKCRILSMCGNYLRREKCTTK